MSDQNLEQRIRDAQANPSDPTRWIEAANALVRAGRVNEGQSAALKAAALDPAAAAFTVYASGAPLSVLPASGGATAVVAASPWAAVAVQALPFAWKPEPALHPQRRWVAGVDPAHERVGLFALDAPQAGVRWFELGPGKDVRVHSVAFNGRALYVGTNGEQLLVRDLDDLEQDWWRAQLPLENVRWGKAIDAILVDGDRLIAVDDMVMPKYNFVFEAKDPLRPSCVRAADLPTHYTYETVYSAALGPSHLALLSSGGGRGGAYTFAAFYDRETLSEEFSLRQLIREPFGDVRARDRSWHTVEMVGSWALIAAGIDGLQGIDLAAPRSGEPQLTPIANPMPAGGELLRVKQLPGRQQAVLAIGQFRPEQFAPPPDPNDSEAYLRHLGRDGRPAIVNYALVDLASLG